MAHANLRCLLVEAAAQLHHAGRASHSYGIRACRLDVLDLLRQHRQGNLAVLDAERACHAAALIRILHLHE